MKKSSLTLGAVVGACALALAVPSLAPRLADVVPAAPTLPSVVTPPTPRQPSTGEDEGGESDEDGPRGGDRSDDGPSTVASGTRTEPSASQTRGVVLIATRTTSGEAAGTGMVLTASGQVLTNYHVVEGSTSVEVEVVDTGRSYRATVVGHDASRDVALLQLADAAGLATVTPDKDALAVGDALTAVGNASGGGELVAAPGTVTALGQRVTVSDESGGSETLTGVIETSAGAVPGDSGGPMFDSQGEVAGMTTAGGQTVTRGPRGGRSLPVTTVSYAVPITDALAVVDQIRSGRETATTQVGAKAYLGITVAGSSGLVVNTVVAGGPAADAGVTAGSTLTSIDGRAVGSHDDLSAQLDRLQAGQRVAIAWTDAEGNQHTGTVTLGTSPVN